MPRIRGWPRSTGPRGSAAATSVGVRWAGAERGSVTAARLASWGMPAALVAIALIYVAAYLGYPSLPGNSPVPNGWWEWADQVRYIASARAFAAGDLDPARHWFPLGYGLLGAPFVRGWKQHPYFLVDLA